MLEISEPVRRGDCEIVEMSSRISTVVLISRSEVGDGSILPRAGRNSSSSSLVVDPEHIGAL